MVPKPIGQVCPVDPAGGEIEHEVLLVIDGCVDLGAVEDEKGLHGGMADALVAVDERVVLDQREAERRGLLDHGRIEIDAIERRLWLCNGGVERTEIADAGRAAASLEDVAVQLDNLPQGEISHQARRRYSSSFFRRTRTAARANSGSGVASRSVIAARASSSGASPRRSASWRSLSACAGERSIVSLMDVLYLVAAPSNNMVEGTSSEQPAAHHKRSVGGCNNSAGEPGKTETRLEESWHKLDEVLEAESLLIGRVTYDSFAAPWPERSGRGHRANEDV